MRGGRLTAIAAVVVVLTGAAASAAPLPPTTRVSDRARWRAILHWPRGCETNWRESGLKTAGIALFRADAGANIVAVECYFGAYQGIATLYLVGAHRRVFGPLELHIYNDLGNGVPTPTNEREILGRLAFTRVTETLTVFDEFRGLGDCGIYSAFRLENHRFVLNAVRAKTACNGKPPLKPWLWPRLRFPLTR